MEKDMMNKSMIFILVLSNILWYRDADGAQNNRPAGCRFLLEDTQSYAAVLYQIVVE